MPSRRDYLAGLSTAGASVIAGCSEFIDGPKVAVSEIRGVNYHTQSHTLTVKLLEDSTNVHQSVQRLPTAKEQTEQPWFVIKDGLPDTLGQYELKALLDDSGSEALDLASEFDGNRLRIIIEITAQGTLSLFINRAMI